MFVNELSTYLTFAESKRGFNGKSSTYYFHMKTKILPDFQIYISVPLTPEAYPKPCQTSKTGFFCEISQRLEATITSSHVQS